MSNKQRAQKKKKEERKTKEIFNKIKNMKGCCGNKYCRFSECKLQNMEIFQIIVFETTNTI